VFRGAGLCLLAIVTSLAIAESAVAAERFASPTGDNSAAATCPIGDPCDIETAIEDVSVMAGDIITVLPGDYAPAARLQPEESPVTIRAQPGGARPRIVVNDDALRLLAGDIVRGLYLECTLNSQAVSANGSTLEQMVIHATPPCDRGVSASNGAVIRDSVVSTNFGGVQGDAVNVSGGGATLSGLTAVGLGLNSDGVVAIAGTQSVTLRNVIARGDGTGAGIRAEDDAVADGDNLDINVAFSNYSSIAETPPEADVIEGAGNQTAAPLFVNASPTVRDFHQLTGSPTINMGSPDGTTGALDFDGETRIMGAALDIGGDEFSGPDPVPITPPALAPIPNVAVQSCAGQNATISGQKATIAGTEGNDNLRGTAGRDVIAGLGGKDTILGLGGNDLICGGNGRDTLLGGAGNDQLRGERGKDTLKGGKGKDKLKGGPGEDIQQQ
jgi:Ca2+-binding RTX toxin-like protein